MGPPAVRTQAQRALGLSTLIPTRAKWYHQVVPSKDGSKPATQADIHAVKADVHAVRSELAAVKTELKKKIDESTKRLALEILKSNDRGDKLEAASDRNTSRILTALDDYTKTAEANNRAILLHGQALSEHGQALKDHDRRLTSVESKS